MRINILVVLVCWSVLMVSPYSMAAVPVITVPGSTTTDGANLVQNTVTAIQSVLMVANQILELTPLNGIIAMGGFAEDLGAIQQSMAQLRGIGWDLSSLDGQFTSLFELDGLPRTSLGLVEWQREYNGAVREARHDAMAVQTILRTLRRTCDHLLGLMASVSQMIGNLQISQTISQAQQKVAQLLSEQQLTSVVHQRAESLQALGDQTETEILNRINCGIWKSWPGMGCE